MKKFIAILLTVLTVFSVPAFAAQEFAKGYVICSSLNVRSAPDTNSQIVAKLSAGEEVGLLYCNGYNWYCVQLENGVTGFCHASYISLEKPSASAVGEKIVQTAKTHLGKPYVYGASGPNAFDCSGFTSYVFAACGISLPRTSSAQATVGTTIDRNSLQAGDLVFFNTSGTGRASHVGIYDGNGGVIHAASGQGRIVINSMSSTYFSTRYLWAKRVY